MTGISTESTSPATPETAGSPSVASAAAVRRRRTKRRVFVVFALLAAALVFLLVEGLGSSLDYFDTVDQAMHQRSTLGTRDFRLEGVVAPGTIVRTSTGADFFLEGTSAHEVWVVESGQPPELFQASIPVVVDGHFTSASPDVPAQFDASQIIVKHTSTYKAQYPGRVRAPNGSAR